jgi:hypothetical protein
LECAYLLLKGFNLPHDLRATLAVFGLPNKLLEIEGRLRSFIDLRRWLRLQASWVRDKRRYRR